MEDKLLMNSSTHKTMFKDKYGSWIEPLISIGKKNYAMSMILREYLSYVQFKSCVR